MDNRPNNCRFRLRDEGKAYPKSRCFACGKGVTTGLGESCGMVSVTENAEFTDMNGYWWVEVDGEKIIAQHVHGSWYACGALLPIKVNKIGKRLVLPSEKTKPDTPIIATR